MKHLTLLLCFFITFNLYAQRKKKSKPINLFKIQGGFLYDAHPEQNYAGFNMINFGWIQQKKNILHGFDLDLIGYDTDTNPFIEPGVAPIELGKDKRRRSIELSYFRSFNLGGSMKNGFYLGPTLSLNYQNTILSPWFSTEFPKGEKCYCLGIGVKADYIYQLKKKIYLLMSTKLMVLDIGYGVHRVFNQNLVIRQQQSKQFTTNFLRRQFPLMIGIGFKL